MQGTLPGATVDLDLVQYPLMSTDEQLESFNFVKWAGASEEPQKFSLFLGQTLDGTFTALPEGIVMALRAKHKALYGEPIRAARPSNLPLSA